MQRKKIFEDEAEALKKKSVFKSVIISLAAVGLVQVAVILTVLYFVPGVCG